MKKLMLFVLCALASPFADAQVDVLVQRGDNARTGQNLNEPTLIQGTVAAATFGKMYVLPVDGYVFAQPLYKSNLVIPGKGTYNVVFAATQHDSVFAFDADTGTPLWRHSFINPSAGVTTQPAADTGTTDIIPEVGITSTPVIDSASGTMYVVAKTKESGSAVFRIHALDVTTGAEKVPAVAIQASVSKTGGGTLSFNANWQQQRPGLVLVNGVVYVGFGSSGDNFTWQGWLLGYNATTLAQTAVWCNEPDGSAGGGIWAAGEAPPVDANFNLFVTTGNGTYDGVKDFGDAFVKLSTPNLAVVDWFSPFNQVAINAADLDIASAGLTLLPDALGTSQHPHLLAGSGKDGTIYLIDRDNMGKFNGSYSSPDAQIVQEIHNAIGIISENPTAIPLNYIENSYSTPGLWRNHLYWCGIDDACKMFDLNSGLLTTSPVSRSPTTFAFGGAQPVVSAASSVATSAIMWAVERDTTNNKTTLHAYDATNLGNELYNSNQAAGNRDNGGAPVKFVVPTVANGKVFIGAQSEVDVFGPLAAIPPVLPAPTFNPVPGTYTGAQSVTLADSNPSAQIYYTVDGSSPTASSLLYTGAIAVSQTTTISAIAVLSGSQPSPITSATYTIGGGPTFAYVQGNYADPQSPQTSVAVKYTAAQSTGDLNVVVVGWNDATTTVKSVTDTTGNAYALAVGPTVQAGTASQAIYYAKNIGASPSNTNSVTVTFSGAAAYPDIRILEYSGIDTGNPLDVVAAAQGNSATASSGAVTTTNASDLIVGANTIQADTKNAGAGFTSRMITAPDSDIVEDEVVTATGSYAATAPVGAAPWIMQLAAFKLAGASTPPTPTAPSGLTATAASTTQINLSWAAATETGGTIGQYLVERCQVVTTTCSNFAQIGTSATTSYSDSGLTAATTYIYRVRAQDTALVTGPYSGTASGTTQSPPTPTAPSALTATAASTTQINLSWAAATETGGTIGQYLVERCQVVTTTCSNFAQIGTSVTTSYSDSGLTASTTYIYRVRAQDTALVTGPYSGTATATTQSPPTPTAPSGLGATAVSATQISLSWAAATESGGTIGQYLVERCQVVTTSCSNFAQVGTSTTTTFADGGLLGSTTYTYRVRAQDTAAVNGPYSASASATTSAPTFTAPGSLATTVIGSTQINLAWVAAIETGGTISQYLIERCQGAACTTFAQVGTSTATTYNNTGLNGSTSYSYRVRATDSKGNLGPYSSIASATTTAGAPPPIAFVQSSYADPQVPSTSVAVKYTAAQGAGDLNVVVVGWNDAVTVVSSVVDSAGNAYALAVGPTVQAGTATQAIYYATNIVAATANTNTVTVTFAGAAAYPDIRILEYSGLDTAAPLDVVAAAQGNSTTSSSGAVTTTYANDLIIGANLTQIDTKAAGTGFTSRIITAPDSDIVEDRVVTATGSYSATASVGSGPWIMQLVAFKRHP